MTNEFELIRFKDERTYVHNGERYRELVTKDQKILLNAWTSLKPESAGNEKDVVVRGKGDFWAANDMFNKKLQTDGWIESRNLSAIDLANLIKEKYIQYIENWRTTEAANKKHSPELLQAHYDKILSLNKFIQFDMYKQDFNSVSYVPNKGKLNKYKEIISEL